MWNWPNRLCFAANIAMFFMAAYFILMHGLEPTADWSYSDLVTVILTALGLILAALALGLGVLSVWGYSTIAQHAVDKSMAAVTQRLDELTKTDELRATIKGLVDVKILTAADEVYNDIAPKYPAEDEQ